MSDSLKQRLATVERTPLTDMDGTDNPDAPDLVKAISDMGNALETLCDERTAAMCLHKVSSTLQIQLPSSEALIGFYEVLCQYPELLVGWATQEIIKHHPYPTFPKPADWVKRIEEKVAEAQAVLNRLKRMQSKMRFKRKRVK